jgi:hypothetical protein
MAITVDATVGGTTSNSYIDVAAADQIMEYRQTTFATWSALSADQKGAALISASQMFDSIKWKGVRTAETQALRWPRSGVYDQDGYAIDDDVIPADVAEALADYAYTVSQGDQFQATGLEGFSEIKVDVIGLKLDADDRDSAIPDRILDRLQYLIDGRSGGSIGSAGVLRA